MTSDRPEAGPSRAIHGLALAAALLGALVLRLYHLDLRALWWDEGLSLLFARLGYTAGARMAVALADTNPPIYRLMLGQWLHWAGSAAWTVRLFSALPGLLLVAVTYRLARRLGLGRVASLLAMSLCAASPMLIYYAQEAKGYSWVALAGAGSVLIWLRAHSQPELRGPKRLGLWTLYGLCLLAAVGSHYIAAFLIVVENLWTALLTWRQWPGNQRRWLTRWAWLLGAQAAAALAVLPFILLTFGGTSAAVRGQTGVFDNLSTLPLLARLALELTQGPGADGPWAWAAAGGFLALAAFGWQGLTGDRRWLLLSWLGLPVLMGVALNAYHEFFFPRFVLYTVPALLIAAAAGLWRIAKRFDYLRATPFPMLALCFAAWSPTLLAQYNASTAPGEDWRPVAEAVRPLIRAGDAAVYVWGWIPGYLDAYLGAAPRPDYALGFFTPSSLDPAMQAITSSHGRIWLFDYKVDQFDVRNLAGGWLRPRSALVYEDWPGAGKGHVALFVLQSTPSQSDKPLEFTFANGLTLDLKELQTNAAPGDSLAVELHWRAGRPLAEPYTVFLHGLAADGSLAFGRDSEPNNGAAPVTGWRLGETHIELRGLLIPPGTPPGAYSLTLGLYKTATGEVDPNGPAAIGAIVVK